MADNVPVTPGSGANIATDQLATGEHVQFVKIMDGTLDGTAKAAVGANGLKVDPSGVTQPVSGTVAVSNLPATQPVSGTVAVSNFPATQPVSVASMPATPVTDNNSTLSVDDGGGSITVDGTVGVSGTVPVSGTFWQATQPVSGSVSVSNFPSTQAVSGTFWQATQPVSVASLPLPSGAATETTLAAVNTKLAGTLAIKDAVDARTNISLYAEAVAGATSEALITLNQSKGYASATTGTDYAVTAGKTLRLLGMYATWVSTTTTANTTRLRIRVNTGGAVTTSSPIAYTGRIGWESATFIANEAEMQPIMFPGGIDIPAGAHVGVTHVEAAANGTIDVQLVGFEF